MLVPNFEEADGLGINEMSNNSVKRFFLNCRIFYFHRKIISDYLTIAQI